MYEGIPKSSPRLHVAPTTHPPSVEKVTVVGIIAIMYIARIAAGATGTKQEWILRRVEHSYKLLVFRPSSAWLIQFSYLKERSSVTYGNVLAKVPILLSIG